MKKTYISVFAEMQPSATFQYITVTIMLTFIADSAASQ